MTALNFPKTLVETAFRWVGFPTRTGLRAIGRPDSDSPVFVTCNFDLTVRRVIRALRGLDCWLLVAPTHGINVWCASRGGFFTAHSIIAVVKTSRLAEKVSHRRLILPQLCAPGVDVARVRHETGFVCGFGPVYAADIPAYVEDGFRKTPAMRVARFPLAEQLEMAAMWCAPLSLIVALVLAFARPAAIPGALALIWGLGLGMFALYGPITRYLPGKISLHRMALVGAAVGAGLAVVGLGWWGWSAWKALGWGLGALGIGVRFGFDFEGNTPLYAPSTVTYWAKRWPMILDIFDRIGFPMEPAFSLHVEPDVCTGCRTCEDVCPKGVFDIVPANGQGLRSVVARPDDCEQCTACVRQCPEAAIVAEPPVRRFEALVL
jgi:NAD-dependent dihydropyrimidine dehydrogenase PreA subunit